MVKQYRARTDGRYVGCNTNDHFIRTYDGVTMGQAHFNRVCSIHKRTIKSTKRTIRGYVVVLHDGQKATINIRG